MSNNVVTAFEQASQPTVRRAAGQATMVEQSRAVAEVQAAVVIAQQRPRDITRALNEMREVCQIQALAERAFFSFNRGGVVTGPSIHLARELARIWGNIDYGQKELRRDDAAAESEMLAFAWDMQTNTRPEVVFIVPHVRDTKSGRKILTDARDIYENNANNAARRLRECIFAVLPVWFVEEAKGLCRKTLEHGGGKPLVQRIADCIAAFEAIGITKAQIEKRVGRVADEMTPEDFGSLRVLYGSIKAGEIAKDEAFPRDEPPTHKQQPADGGDGFEQASAGKVADTKPAPKTEAQAAESTQQPAADAQDQGSQQSPAAETSEWDVEFDALKAEGLTCQNFGQWTAFLEDYAGRITAMQAGSDTHKAAWIEFSKARMGEFQAKPAKGAK